MSHVLLSLFFGISHCLSLRLFLYGIYPYNPMQMQVHAGLSYLVTSCYIPILGGAWRPITGCGISAEAPTDSSCFVSAISDHFRLKPRKVYILPCLICWIRKNGGQAKDHSIGNFHHFHHFPQPRDANHTPSLSPKIRIPQKTLAESIGSVKYWGPRE